MSGLSSSRTEWPTESQKIFKHSITEVAEIFTAILFSLVPRANQPFAGVDDAFAIGFSRPIAAIACKVEFGSSEKGSRWWAGGSGM
jgi:hypothetical protein